MTLESPTSTFPLVQGRRKGYDPAAVDAFLMRARDAFEAGDASLTSAEIRRTGFRLVRHGYEIGMVDAGLGRLEDAFAAREREGALSRAGARAWVGQSRKLAQEILDRMSRPQRRRFRRVGVLHYGYRIDEVDIVAERIAAHLESGEQLSPEQVRSVAFRMQRRGYDETQVDAVLDATVEVMLAVG
ncbi:DivIVA domain-containing protein [Microbacterium telephonicum]|uniref:DivIVA domain-containing protein n=1 Tax=Microbacterium telephonicum TaxID=1714841 RepID=A0A498C043_9MICO|nr:DivIVA domain-containing protein [Microbacterium telephonicum]RLK49314.1 DivIVA domain-containing protein [Microbacterium telephonicum]